jgi:Flp pilus assembly protein TadB
VATTAAIQGARDYSYRGQAHVDEAGMTRNLDPFRAWAVVLDIVLVRFALWSWPDLLYVVGFLVPAAVLPAVAIALHVRGAAPHPAEDGADLTRRQTGR